VTEPGSDAHVSRETSADRGASSHSVSRETMAHSHNSDHDETPIATETATALRVLGRSGEVLPRPRQRRVLTVANQKGGVGKTTTTVNIAAAMALHGLRVLVVDLDPQGNASTALGIDHHADIPSVYDLLIEGKTVADVATPVPEIEGLWCVPATIDLAGAEIELVSVVARESRLKRALVDVDVNVDYVLIDCPPSLGLLTVNALVAAEEVLIPIQCEYYALEGLGQLLRNIDLVKSHLNPELHVSTILLTMYDARTRLASQVADDVRTHFGSTVLRTVIPRSVRVSEAPSYGQTVMTYDPASSGALCYLDAAREIAERGAAQGATEQRAHGTAQSPAHATAQPPAHATAQPPTHGAVVHSGSSDSEGERS
jgi:chromosome partitioning protein